MTHQMHFFWQTAFALRLPQNLILYLEYSMCQVGRGRCNLVGVKRKCLLSISCIIEKTTEKIPSSLTFLRSDKRLKGQGKLTSLKNYSWHRGGHMSQALYFLGRDLCAREFRVKNGASAEKSLLTADPTEMLVDLFGWSENFYSICRSRKRSQKQQDFKVLQER